MSTRRSHKLTGKRRKTRARYTRKDSLDRRFAAIRQVLGQPEDKSFGSPFGVFIYKDWPCGCERTVSADGHVSEDIFAPCRKHKHMLPGWRSKVQTRVGPQWEKTLLGRKGKIVKLGACQPGDTVRYGEGIYLVEPFPDSIKEEERLNRVWITTLHPATSRGRFITVGRTGAARADQEVYRLNTPSERYDFDEKGRLIEERY